MSGQCLESVSSMSKSFCFVFLGFFFFWVFFNVYLFLRQRETEREWGRGRERGETQNQKQAPGSELSAQSPTRGSNSRTVRSRPEVKSDAQPTEPPRRP